MKSMSSPAALLTYAILLYGLSTFVALHGASLEAHYMGAPSFGLTLAVIAILNGVGAFFGMLAVLRGHKAGTGQRREGAEC